MFPSRMSPRSAWRQSLRVTSVLGLTAVAACAHKPHAPPVPTAGQLTASEPLSAAFSLPDVGSARRITYLSTNGITGSGLVPVTAEVFTPRGRPPKGGWPIVAWAHGTVGIADACAPSANPVTERNSAYLSAWIKRGFAIVATDYQGLGTPGPHPYLNTRTEAYSVLDSVRATLSGLKGFNNKVMIVGQSQGAGAAFAAAAYAPDYAPKLDIRGTVATGIPYMTPAIAKAMAASLTSHKGGTTDGFDPTVAYGLLLGASLGELNPSFDPNTAFTSKALPTYRAASQLCINPLFERAKADGLTTSNTFKRNFAQAIAPVLASMAYPTLKLAHPLFVGTGTADKDVSPKSQLALVRDACAAGSTVQAHVYNGLDHSAVVLASLADSASFTDAVMNGKPVAGQCNPVAQ